MIDETDPNKGIIYVATGSVHAKMAIASAESVKKHNPLLKTHLFTDQLEIVSPYIDSCQRIAFPHRRSKVDYIHQTPFDKTLFLDSDTIVRTNIEDMFKLLERFDLAMTHGIKRNSANSVKNWKIDIPKSFPHLSSGVILFKKNDQTMSFFQEWQKAYLNANFKKDQTTLRELLWLSDLRFYVLPPEYNVRYRKYLSVWTKEEAEPKILHFEDIKLFHKIMNEKNSQALISSKLKS